MKKKKLLFIFNPRAGKGQIRSRLFRIIDTFVKAGYEVTVHPTQRPQDGYEKTKELASEVDIIVCGGGDGTLDEVVNGLMAVESQIPLGYIPAGSTNDFASSVNISKNILQAAKDVVLGEPCSLDIGLFNHMNFVYIAAFGLFTDVSYETDQNLKNILGHLAYLLEGTKRIFNVPSHILKVYANDVVLEAEYIYGMITNARSVGGFKNLVGPGVELDDGLFEVTLIRRPKNPIELNEIVTSLMSAEDKTELIDNFKTNCIRIESEEKIAWTLDGEFGGEHDQVEIENKRHALNLIVNQNK